MKRGPARTVLITIVTMILEKNPFKRVGLDVKFVISMARVISLASSVVTLHRVWTVPVLGWPDATLAIANVLSLSIIDAIQRSKPEETLKLAEALIARFGIGDVPHLATAFAGGGREPSKFDDHRMD